MKCGGEGRLRWILEWVLENGEVRLGRAWVERLEDRKVWLVNGSGLNCYKNS